MTLTRSEQRQQSTLGPTGTRPPTVMWHHRWNALAPTATQVRWSRHMGLDQRFNGGLRAPTMGSSTPSRTSGPSPRSRCHTPRHLPTSLTCPLARHPRNIPLLICLRLRPRSRDPECSRLIHLTRIFGIHPASRTTMLPRQDTQWHLTCLSALVTPRTP